MAAPTTTIQDANIGATEARLNALVANDGGAACEGRFRYRSLTISSIDETEVIEVYNGDGSVYYNGYIYLTSRANPATLTKIKADDYTDVTTVELKADGTNVNFVDDIIEEGGYLWMGCQDGLLYKVDPSDLSVVDYWYMEDGSTELPMWRVYFLCSDGTYIFCGGTNWEGVRGEVGRFQISNQAIMVKESGLPANSRIHSLIEDGDYIYGHTNAPSADKRVFKIQKSDLSLVASVQVAEIFCDDVVQDDTYLYLAGHSDTTNVVRFRKSDLDRTDLSPSIDKDLDGQVIHNGTLLTLLKFAEGGLHKMAVIDLDTFTRTAMLSLKGLTNDTWRTNELVLSNDYVHVHRGEHPTTGYVILGAFNKSDVPPAWVETSWANGLTTDDPFSADITGLTQRTEYEFQAQNKNEDEGDWSTSKFFTTGFTSPLPCFLRT